MRISDWSSDVCSSDLALGQVGFGEHRADDQRADRCLRSGLEHERAAGRDRRCHLVRDQVEREVEWRYERTRPDGHALGHAAIAAGAPGRSEEHTSELQSLMRISYAVFCLKKKKQRTHI